MASASKTVFHISHAPFSERYRISPQSITAGSRYSVDVEPRTSARRPFMVLHDDSQKRICGLVRRPMNSSTFEIRLSGWGDASSEKGHPDDEGDWNKLTCPSSSTALWSVCLSTSSDTASDKTRTFAWVRSSMGLAGRGMRLVDVTDMQNASADSLKDATAVAVFERKKGLMSFGRLEVEGDTMSFGHDFVRMLVLTTVCLTDKISKTATNSIRWGSSGFEKPVY